MKDMIYREDAIETVRKIVPVETEIDATLLDKAEVIVELSALPSAEAVSREDYDALYKRWVEAEQRADYYDIDGDDEMAIKAPSTEAKDDLISREEALRMIITAGECEPDLGYTHLHKVIESLPSAEAVQGEWYRDSEGTWATVDFAYCSECKQHIIHKHASPLWRFCPNCGARMTPYKGGEG